MQPRIPASLRTALGLVLPLLAACASNPDVENQRLQTALEQSTTLSNEILTWRSHMTGTVPTSVVATVESFKARAEHLTEEIDDISQEVIGDVQIPAVQQALESLATFEVERFETASPEGRKTLLDQFSVAAMAVKDAVTRARNGSFRS